MIWTTIQCDKSSFQTLFYFCVSSYSIYLALRWRVCASRRRVHSSVIIIVFYQIKTWSDHGYCRSAGVCRTSVKRYTIFIRFCVRKAGRIYVRVLRLAVESPFKDITCLLNPNLFKDKTPKIRRSDDSNKYFSLWNILPLLLKCVKLYKKLQSDPKAALKKKRNKTEFA